MVRSNLPVLLALLVAGCTTTQPASVHPTSECDVSWVKDEAVGRQKACALRVLAKRCAVSDRCYIACEANGGAPNVGGGCAHICMNVAQTDEEIARNGGPYMTQEAADCYNRK